MGDIVISVVAKFAECLVKPAIRVGKSFLCVDKVVRDLEEEKNELISERISLLDRIERVEGPEIIEEPVKKWRDDAGKLVKEVEDLEQKMEAITSCFQGRFPTWRRYRLCEQMIKKKEAMEKLKGKSNIQPFSHRAPLPIIQYLSSQNFTYFESTKVAYNQLMEALEDDCNYMIGVYGMGGCGKTTLVMEVGKMVQESHMFDKVIPITMSQTPNIKGIQGIMASGLNLELDKDSEEERAAQLWLGLKQREQMQILVIMDDLWEEFDLKHIGIHFDNVNKGTKILVTTRNQSVCASMDCQKNIYLELLSEEESWSLFHQRAKIDDKFSESLNGVPRELCEECKGLPIAIITIASSLKGKHKAEWEVALDNLRNSGEFDEHDKGVSAALSCLELSYKYLQNKEAELLFLMCSMFPEDDSILIEDLIRYAIGLGVGAGRSSLELKRSLIRAGINKLLDYCLLLRVKDMQCVKMHDLVRDTALWIAKRSENRKILVNVDKPLDTLAEDDNIRKCFAVSLWRSNKDPSFSQLHAPNLEMLFLNASSFDLSGLTCERLHVLSLTRSYAGEPLSLPPSSQLLKTVRTLRLNELDLGDISFIASLIALEVFDLRGCNFSELPNEIGRLGRLKLLDLSRCRISQNNYNGAIGKCSQLEELYASDYNPDGERLHPSIIMDIVTLPKLQRFVISTKHIELDMVRVVGGMNNLAKLSLMDWPEIECIFNTISSSKADILIPMLVKLRLHGMKNLKELCRGPPLQVLSFFEKLEVLQIEGRTQLHNIFPRECNLKNLKELTIMGCTSVEVLFPTSVGQSLLQLESIVIVSCDDLKHIIASGREHGGCNTSKEIVPAMSPSDSHFPMPSLREVHVSSCQKLELIFPVCYAEGLARLQEISIWHSPELKYVFGECDHENHSFHQDQNHTMLPHLEVLSLDGLENLVGMCPESCHAKWPSQSLRKLIVKDCPKLATSWIAVMTCSDQRQHCLNEHLPLKLQELDLVALPQLSPPPCQMWSLQFLQRLRVVNCENLKCLFSIELCGSLQELVFLSINNCPQLEQIVAANEEPVQLPNTEVYFPKLKEIEVRSCNKLKSLVIRNCDELKHIIASGREHGGCNTSKEIVPALSPSNSHFAMPSLRKVHVSSCQKLESIIPVCYVEGLARLQEIKIRYGPELKYVFGECDHEHHSSHQYQNHTMLPHLEVFELTGLQNLVGMCPEHCHAKWPSQSLRKLSVTDCPKLATSWIAVMTGSDQRQHHLNENLPLKLQELDLVILPQLSPTPWQMWSLQFLQRLRVSYCEKLECLFSMELRGSLQELMYLIINDCQELEQIVAANEEPVQLPNTEVYFPKLKQIEVYKCDKLKSLFPVAMVRMLPQLSNIGISDCTQLEEVFRDGRGDGTTNQTEVVLPNLTKIELSDLPSFVDICQGCKLQVVKLQRLRINECPKIAPSLKAIQVTLKEEGRRRRR